MLVIIELHKMRQSVSKYKSNMLVPRKLVSARVFCVCARETTGIHSCGRSEFRSIEACDGLERLPSDSVKSCLVIWKANIVRFVMLQQFKTS